MRGVKFSQQQEGSSLTAAAAASAHPVALQLPLNPSSSSSPPSRSPPFGRRNLKQATSSAFSALDLRQTFNGSESICSASPVVAVAAASAGHRAALIGSGNKSRARSCYGDSAPATATGTFRPVGRHPDTRPRSERSPLPTPKPSFSRAEASSEESFESELNNSEDHQHHRRRSSLAVFKRSNSSNNSEDIKLYDDCNQLTASLKSTVQKQQQLESKGRQQGEAAMSQTIQSIQSLSMQLNRAASMSASLDDAMSMSQQDISGANHGPAGTDSGNIMGGKKLTQLMGKKAGRMKEILLQNLGKAQKTTDELFEMYEENFYKQQAQAVKIQKEFKSYINSLKGTQDAGKSLNVCIQQSTGVYQSARHDLVCENLSQLDILGEDLLEKLRGQIQVSLCEYMSQFGELREKILKRKRKLIDYDSSRRVYELMLANIQRKRQLMQQPQDLQNHHQRGIRALRPSFMVRSSGSNSPAGGACGNGNGNSSSSNNNSSGTECIQSAASQLVDEARLLKLREQYNYCKLMFETINSELYQELPMVYEKKMRHLLMTLQNYFSLEAQFHSNAGKLFATAGDVIDELPMSIHRAQQHNPLQQQQQQQQQQHQKQQQKIGKPHEHDYVDHKTSGSSGMGSSRGDSSLESSSSPDNSVNGSASPLPQQLARSEPASPHQQEDSQRQPSEDAEPQEQEDGVGKELPPPPPSSSSISVSTIDEITLEGGDMSCQLDSLSMEFGDSSVSDSVDTGDLEALKQEQQLQDEDDQQGSTSDSSSCSVIEVKPEAENTGADKRAGGYLYKVKTSYKYLAEDVDELCFEADEIIQVVEFDENQEQEEGWLMGVREVNGQKGLFPANFTKPIN